MGIQQQHQKHSQSLEHDSGTSGVIGLEQKLSGEKQIRVESTFTGSGVLSVQGRIEGGTTWTELQTLTAGGDIDTADVSSYDYIRFNFTTPAGSAGSVVSSGFFREVTVADAFSTIQGDSGTNPVALNASILSILGGNNITTEGDSSTDTLTIDSSLRYAHFYHQATSGTGGTTTANTWVTRTLTHLASYGTAFASLSSNQMTITEAGTYLVYGWGPSYRAGRHMTQLYDITNSTAQINGEVLITGAGTITANDVFEHRSIAEVTLAGYGLGIDANGAWSSTHRWGSVFFFKVA